MLCLFRGLKCGRCHLEDCCKSKGIYKRIRPNLKQTEKKHWKTYSTRSDLTVPGKYIENYIKTVTSAHVNIYGNEEEIKNIIQIREVKNILNNRITIEENLKNLKELVENDDEMKKLGEEELTMYHQTLEKLDDELLDAIVENLGRDNCKDIIFEITAGVGGLEAMLFAAELFNMYQGHFDYLGFSHEAIEIDTEVGIGGMRHASILVSGQGAYELLRHEGGVHRVQRIPTTEKSGRMHTSTVTVAVMPQPSEIEVNLKDKDLKIETKKSSAPGGQNANTTDSAVRITHLPTGLSVESQKERSQIRNRSIAMLKLRSKIYEMQLNEQQESVGSLRKKQRGMSSRNEKVRTYNYSQDRITDHRISNATMHNLKGFMEGGENLEALQFRLQRNFQLKILQETIEKCK